MADAYTTTESLGSAGGAVIERDGQTGALRCSRHGLLAGRETPGKTPVCGVCERGGS